MPDEQVISHRDLLIKGSTAVAGGEGRCFPRPFLRISFLQPPDKNLLN